MNITLFNARGFVIVTILEVPTAVAVIWRVFNAQMRLKMRKANSLARLTCRWSIRFARTGDPRLMSSSICNRHLPLDQLALFGKARRVFRP